jgi:hypothetical protein
MGILKRLIAKTKFLLRTKPIVHILSDSHGEAFKYVDWTKFNITPSFCIVQGATASGIDNPNGQTKARAIFDGYTKSNIKSQDYILFELGEIDCGFVIWHRAKKHNIHIDEQLSFTINKYFEFIKSFEWEPSKVIIASAILPTIKDNLAIGEIANLRKEVTASQFERTNLTKLFNAHIKLFCEQSGWLYLDIERHIFNHNTGLVNDLFLNKDPSNHHLDEIILSKIINDCLIKASVF